MRLGGRSEGTYIMHRASAVDADGEDDFEFGDGFQYK